MKNNVVILYLVLFIFFSSCTLESQKRSSMNLNNTTLWYLIGALSDEHDFTLEIIEKLFQNNFVVRHHATSFATYEGGPVRLSDQIKLEKIELRVGHADGIGKLMTLDISGACITFKDVYMHYPNIVLSEIPRGNSFNEATFYSFQQPHEKLSFGFKENNPECLSMVVFNRTNRG